MTLHRGFGAVPLDADSARHPADAMPALTVTPGTPGSVRLHCVPAPSSNEGPVLLDTLSVGICGTDHEIINGRMGDPPEGRARLVLGHEVLARVREAPGAAGLQPGDLVTAMVRRPDPMPCGNCAVGEWDMCTNGLFTEHGVKGLDGFARAQFRSEASRLVKLPPSLASVGYLVEPASVVAKAWEHITRIGERAQWQPRRVLITGAGPIGLLAALMARQRGLDTHVVDPAPARERLVTAVGARYHQATSPRLDATRFDVVMECSGNVEAIHEAISRGGGEIVCLLGLADPADSLSVSAAAFNQGLLHRNGVVFGSVNANAHHYHEAVRCLEDADSTWLDRLVSRRVALHAFPDAFTRQEDDIKVVIDFPAASGGGQHPARRPS